MADAALSVLSSILRMLVIAGAREPQLAIRASRCLLQISEAVLAKWPSSEILTVLFGVYQIYVACDWICEDVLQNPQDGFEDIHLLSRIGDAVAVVAEQDADVSILAGALHDTIARVSAV